MPVLLISSKRRPVTRWQCQVRCRELIHLRSSTKRLYLTLFFLPEVHKLIILSGDPPPLGPLLSRTFRITLGSVLHLSELSVPGSEIQQLSNFPLQSPASKSST